MEESTESKQINCAYCGEIIPRENVAWNTKFCHWKKNDCKSHYYRMRGKIRNYVKSSILEDHKQEILLAVNIRTENEIQRRRDEDELFEYRID